MKSTYVRQLLLAVYIFGVVVTFGHAWHRLAGALLSTDVDRGAYEEGVCVGSMSCAVVWPLYWSAVAWDGVAAVSNDKIQP